MQGIQSIYNKQNRVLNKIPDPGILDEIIPLPFGALFLKTGNAGYLFVLQFLQAFITGFVRCITI